MEAARSDFPRLAGDEPIGPCSAGGEVAWWTFAGGQANAALALRLSGELDARGTSDNFSVRFPPQQGPEPAEAAFRGLHGSDPAGIEPRVSQQVLEGLEFAECLPPGLVAGVFRARPSDVSGAVAAPHRPTRSVVAGRPSLPR